MFLSPIQKITFFNTISSKPSVNSNPKNNLAPLAKDTVSFTGVDKITQEVVEEFIEKVGKKKKKGIKDEDKFLFSVIGPVVRKVLHEAEPVYNDYKKTLEKVFKSTCSYKGNSPKKPVAELYTNFKSQHSTMAKLVDKRISKADDMKAQVTDMIRARIVLNSGSKSESNIIFNELAKAAEKGDLKILEIRDYRNTPQTGYFSQKNLDKITDALLTRSESIESFPHAKDSGYCAVHILFELKNGFKSELQVMGKNIEHAKKVEDILYKIKTDRLLLEEKPKAIEKAYKKLKPMQKNALDDYIRNVYLEQRQKELNGIIDNNLKKLPEESIVPQFFDFETLHKFLSTK